MMLWKNFRDQLTIMLVLLLIGFLGYCAWRNVSTEIIMMIVGAIIVWLGQMVTFYYRKRTTEEEAQTQ